MSFSGSTRWPSGGWLQCGQGKNLLVGVSHCCSVTHILYSFVITVQGHFSPPSWKLSEYNRFWTFLLFERNDFFKCSISCVMPVFTSQISQDRFIILKILVQSYNEIVSWMALGDANWYKLSGKEFWILIKYFTFFHVYSALKVCTLESVWIWHVWAHDPTSKSQFPHLSNGGSNNAYFIFSSEITYYNN